VLAEIDVEDDELALDVEDVDELVCEALPATLKTLAADCCVRPVVGFDAAVFFDVSA
jgi:hypothetical protein